MDDSRIAGIYLAAGKSSRMGTNKLNLSLGSECLGSKAFRAALESLLAMTFVVTSKSDSLQWLHPFFKQTGWISIEMSEAEEGQSASLKTGVRLAQEMGAEGLVVLLADQPFITKNMINHLIAEFHRLPHLSYLAFSHKGLVRPPVLFNKRLFPRLLELKGDQGARGLIRGELTEQGMEIEIADELYFFDVDTKVDYLSAAELLTNRLLHTNEKNCHLTVKNRNRKHFF